MSEINKIRNRVNSLAQGIFNDSQLMEDGSLLISFQSTMLIVRVSEIPEELREFSKQFSLSNNYVDVRAIILSDVKITNSVLEYVATFSPTDFFPGVSLYVGALENGKGNIVAGSVISADDLDESELRTALLNVAITADFLDDDLQGKFGGSKMSD